MGSNAMPAVQSSAVSKATRFEVFKRDKFTCQYCGAKAPDVMLECDHIHPRAKGGGRELTNLVTACRACNNGKRDKTLSDDSVVTKQHAQLAQLQERREQLEMMMEWQRGLVDLTAETVDSIERLFSDFVPGWHMNEASVNDVRAGLARYPLDEVVTMLREAAQKHVRFAGSQATEESAEVVIRVFLNELKYRKKRQQDPVGSELAYISGIVKKRCIRWSTSRIIHCRERLREAHDEGVTLPELKRIAIESGSWRDWNDHMDDYLRGFREAVSSNDNEVAS